MRKLIRQTTAGVAGLLLLGAVGTGFAQQMSGMKGTAEGQQAQAAPPIEDQLKQIQNQLAALRKELAEVKGARRGQMPMSPGTTGGQPGQMMPMCPMMGMMGQMGQMGQMGGMGAPAPQPKAE